jgi:hypothetical protein
MRLPLPLLLCSVALLAACGRTPPPVVEQAPPPPPPSAWLEPDSKAVADELMTELLKRPWVATWRERLNRQPKVAVGELADRSHGAVDLTALAAQLTRALGAGGQVAVADKAAADLLLTGSVGAEDGVDNGEPVKRYQIDLKLVEAKSGDSVTTLSIERKKDDKVVPAAK